ncbi:hypothetical protein O6H91_08G117200 [Diphasiastrum complanatum]|uniref:Uncharacterized protein n=1 Tax=Diphasiastrum complanatum TaxID=34168 RepID=A0ACC2D297_DIPCM|nr:hypothetical protein O6H91_08G117200 [Diphasiastrum complanatum]
MAVSAVLAPNFMFPALNKPSLSSRLCFEPTPAAAQSLGSATLLANNKPFQAGVNGRRINLRRFRCSVNKGNTGSGGGGSRGGSGGDKFSPLFANGNSEIESPVPYEQQPINEYQSLLDSVYFSWAVEDVWSYGLKLGAIGASFTLLLGWPVAAASVNPEQEFWKCGMGAVCGGIMCTTLSALRLYLGWAYVGNRLFSATVEYEETGWYDGQVWVKPPEVLARDRLLGSYTVKPALNRVKLTLVALALSLTACVLILSNIPTPSKLSSRIEPDADAPMEKIHANYSAASAHRFEPDAFAQEKFDEKALFDYCK